MRDCSCCKEGAALVRKCLLVKQMYIMYFKPTVTSHALICNIIAPQPTPTTTHPISGLYYDMHVIKKKAQVKFISV